MFKKSIIFLAILYTIFVVTSQAEEARLLRFPDIYQDKIAFVYANDLWLVNSQGGLARKLTNHPGLEFFPKFSPDGKQIAFTAEYEGSQNVYLIPAEGGEPKRLTFHPGGGPVSERMGYEDMVLDWFPDGSKVLFRSRRETLSAWVGRLYGISTQGGLAEPLPIPDGGLTSFSPDGKKIALCRTFRDFRTWKRYKGGMAQEIWVYDLKSLDLERVTDYVGVDHFPMWYKDRIYFVSDRTNTSNIYCYDVKTKQTRQVTNYTDYDVKWPSLGPEALVYELGGFLYVMDLPSEKIRKVPVELNTDRILAREEFVTVSEKVLDYNLSPDGKRAVIGARGEVFTVPAEKGNTRNLTNSSNAHEKYSTWSPDGKWVAYVSDKSGEDEVYMIPQDGKGEETRLTTGGNAYKYAPVWSPDSKKLVYSDKNLKIYYLDIDSKQVTLVDQAKRWEIREYSWSPDSKWLTYSKPLDNQFSTVFLFSLDFKKNHQISTGFTNDGEPTFDPNGKYLYFFSNRDFNAVLGNFEQSFTYNRTTKLYAATLQADSASPFAPQSDEVDMKKEEKKEEGQKEGKDKKDKEKKEEKVKPVQIDLEGIQDRQVGFPVSPGNYFGLRAADGKIFYLSASVGGLSGKADPETTALHVFDMEKRKDNVFMSGLDGYDISYDGKKVIYKKGNQIGIVDVKSEGSAKPGEGSIDLSGMQTKVNHKQEWEQIFYECWRLERDFFYAPNMHGVDWNKMKEKYGQMLPYVSHRSDLTYLIGEMIGELACSHTYVGGGEYPEFKKPKTGLLGIDWEADSSSGYYRIKKILKGENWKDDLRSPLTEPGIEVKEGEYIVAVDGQPLTLSISPYSLLVNKADKLVTLSVNSSPGLKGAREVTVKPIDNESELRYYNWVEENRQKVDKATDGKVGYVHIPDMGGNGLNWFTKQYFPQINKEGLVIDVRYNGGGFVSEMILERLRRIVVGMGSSRNAADYTYPGAAFYGHMVCLINEYSASDGDIFPYYFREYGLGPVIGKRTWGGVVGIRGFRPLVDGGYITCPEFAAFGLDSKWVMENHGVDPDIEVDNLPKLVMEGQDPQLEKGIEVLLKKIKEEPKKLPQRPGYPEKK
jgi:tricorn protease